SRSGSVVVESVEPRTFMSVSTWSSSTVSSLSGNYFGDVLVGDNGDPWGVAAGIAGQGSTKETWNYTEWDSDLDDGMDSDWRTFGVSINTANNGEVDFQVGSGTSSYTTSPSGVIHSVKIAADVSGSGLSMDWQDLTVSFYRDGRMIESDSLADFGVSTMNGGYQQEKGVVLTPTATNCNGVSIVGSVRLQAAAGTWPGGTDIMGQVAIT